jgi:serine/threonine protein phosphatase PrpC
MVRPRTSPIQSVLSALLAFALTFTSYGTAAAFSGVDPNQQPLVQRLTPPVKLGTVSASYLKSDKAPTVVLIQDLHAHYQVQKNISAILNHLNVTLGGRENKLPFKLAVEGASGSIVSSYIANYPESRAKRAALDKLMRQGDLTGAEHFALQHRLPYALVGVENADFYKTHRELFRTTIEQREQLVKSLKDVSNELQQTSKSILSSRVRRIADQSAAFERGSSDFNAYLSFLASLARELELPLATGYPRVARSIAQGRIDGSEYADLLQETNELAFRLSLANADSRAEKDFIQVNHDLALLLRIADLQAVESEVRDFAPRLNEFIALAKALTKNIDTALLRRLVSSSVDYYVMALMRNRPMAENTLRLLAEPGSRLQGTPSPTAASLEPGVAVLVAGGFHTAEMTAMLRQKGANVIVITPTVGKLTKADHELYVQRLSEDLNDAPPAVPSGASTTMLAVGRYGALLNARFNRLMTKPATISIGSFLLEPVSAQAMEVAVSLDAVSHRALLFAVAHIVGAGLSQAEARDRRAPLLKMIRGQLTLSETLALLRVRAVGVPHTYTFDGRSAEVLFVSGDVDFRSVWDDQLRAQDHPVTAGLIVSVTEPGRFFRRVHKKFILIPKASWEKLHAEDQRVILRHEVLEVSYGSHAKTISIQGMDEYNRVVESARRTLLRPTQKTLPPKTSHVSKIPSSQTPRGPSEEDFFRALQEIRDRGTDVSPIIWYSFGFTKSQVNQMHNWVGSSRLPSLYQAIVQILEARRLNWRAGTTLIPPSLRYLELLEAKDLKKFLRKAGQAKFNAAITGRMKLSETGLTTEDLIAAARQQLSRQQEVSTSMSGVPPAAPMGPLAVVGVWALNFSDRPVIWIGAALIASLLWLAWRPLQRWYQNGLRNDRLLAVARSSDEGIDVGGGILRYEERTGRKGLYLPTKSINEDDLPFFVGQRDELRDKPLPRSLNELPPLHVTMPKDDIYLVSESDSGSESLVRLGFWKGRPVAVIKNVRQIPLPPAEEEKLLLQDYRGALIARRLGQGPDVHGRYRDNDGEWTIVIDIIPGDFPEVMSASLSPATVKEFRTLHARAIARGIPLRGDIQAYITPSGSFQILDAHPLRKGTDAVRSSNLSDKYTAILRQLLIPQPLEQQKQALLEFAADEPANFNRFGIELVDDIRERRRLISGFGSDYDSTKERAWLKELENLRSVYASVQPSGAYDKSILSELPGLAKESLENTAQRVSEHAHQAGGVSTTYVKPGIGVTTVLLPEETIRAFPELANWIPQDGQPLVFYRLGDHRHFVFFRLGAYRSLEEAKRAMRQAAWDVFLHNGISPVQIDSRLPERAEQDSHGLSVANSEGLRPQQEDRHLATRIDLPGVPHGRGELLLVADGHGGHQAALYAISQFPGLFKSHLSQLGDDREALRLAFEDLQKLMRTDAYADVGTTLAALYRPDGEQRVSGGSVGDSSIVVVYPKTSIRSRLHNVGLDPLQAHHALIQGAQYVEGALRIPQTHRHLNLARSIGDYRFDNYLIRDMEPFEAPLEPGAIVLLGTDGVFGDLANVQNEAENIAQRLRAGDTVADILRDLIADHPADNATLMTLRPAGQRSDAGHTNDFFATNPFAQAQGGLHPVGDPELKPGELVQLYDRALHRKNVKPIAPSRRLQWAEQLDALKSHSEIAHVLNQTPFLLTMLMQVENLLRSNPKYPLQLRAGLWSAPLRIYMKPEDSASYRTADPAVRVDGFTHRVAPAKRDTQGHFAVFASGLSSLVHELIQLLYNKSAGPDPFNRAHTIAFFVEGIVDGLVIPVMRPNKTVLVAIPKRAIREIEAMSFEQRTKFIDNYDAVGKEIRTLKFPQNDALQEYALTMAQALNELARHIQSPPVQTPAKNNPSLGQTSSSDSAPPHLQSGPLALLAIFSQAAGPVIGLAVIVIATAYLFRKPLISAWNSAVHFYERQAARRQAALETARAARAAERSVEDTSMAPEEVHDSSALDAVAQDLGLLRSAKETRQDLFRRRISAAA